MDKIELLMPAGDTETLRAAVANGADAVYLGVDGFNARQSAGNFRRDTLPSVVGFCHKSGVKVYVTANILVKNRELEEYVGLAALIGASGADAIIMQDPWLIPLVREHAPGCAVHLSTQAATSNRRAVPEGADRVILPRELSLDGIISMARHVPVEVFAHGALCLSYSGQCLFSSMAGGRSGNRGRCAQPCRKRYNGEYPLSTRDLCLLEKLPDVISTGAAALKVEGRMRSPLYVGTVARIYRKYIDKHYTGGFFIVDYEDQEALKLAFNREFTTGFAFKDSVVDPAAPTNRGLFLGTMRRGMICLESDLKVGDGIMVLDGADRTGNVVRSIKVNGKQVASARKSDVVLVEVRGAKEGSLVYKSFSADLKADLGRHFEPVPSALPAVKVKLPELPEERVAGQPGLFVRVRSPSQAADADKAGADIIYYNLFADDLDKARDRSRSARFFVATPSVMSDRDIDDALELIARTRPDGALVGERGMLSALMGKLPELHLAQSLNVFNDVDVQMCGGIPVISPELSFDELSRFRSRKFIAAVHGRAVLMTTREPIAAKVLQDDEGRRFPTRRSHGMTEVLNCTELGLFGLAKRYLDVGIKRFYLEPDRDAGKFVKVYRRILAGERFDDRRIRKGYTTGHFRRGVE